MKVNKSLLAYGFAVPDKNVSALMKSMNIDLKKGESCDIRISLDGLTYYAQLKSLNFSEKYRNQERVQVRYSSTSEIARKMNELFREDAEHGTDRKISVYGIGEKALKITFE